ncbi:MAG: hypothetical protein ABI172_04490 [Ginsengibacter sp.]
MKESIIEVEEKKFNFFFDLLKNFDFVSIKELSKRDEIIAISKGMRQAKLASDGKFKSRSAKSFLNEL